MQNRSWWSARFAASAVVLSLGMAACVDAVAPPVEPGDALLALQTEGGPTDEDPFYYYQGERIRLEIDPTEMVVATRVPEGAGVAREVLASLGITPGEDVALPQAAGHRVIRLGAGTTRAQAMEARARLRRDGRVAFAAPAYRAAASRERVLLLNRVAVRFKDGTTRGQIEALNAQLGTRIVREPQPERGWREYWLEYPATDGRDPLAIAALLDRHPLVAWADPDKVQDRRQAYIPTDPFFADQYYLRNNTFFNNRRVDINAVHAWDLTTGGWAPSTGGFRIAVVDDGVEASHPDFGGSVSWGYDAFELDHNRAANPECSGDNHGTQVAGVILQQHNNGAGGAGGAPGVYLVPIRIFRCGLPASDAQIANGINFAWYWMSANVVNNSWGGGLPSNHITTAINNGNTQGRGGKGTVMVFAAGNTSNRNNGHIGAVQYPATLASTVAVGAINRNGAITNYSPEGSTINLVAPSGHLVGPPSACGAGDVVTTDLVGWRGCNNGPGGNIDYTSTFTGTSASAPMVAAVFSLLLAREPALTAATAKSRVYGSADYWGVSTRFGSGKVNAYRALVGKLSVYVDGPTWVSTPGYHTYTAYASGGQQAYSYQWEVSYDGMSYFPMGNAQSVGLWVGPGDQIYLQVRVDQGPDDARVWGSTYIYSPQPCNNDPWAPPGQICHAQIQ